MKTWNSKQAWREGIQTSISIALPVRGFLNAEVRTFDEISCLNQKIKSKRGVERRE